MGHEVFQELKTQPYTKQIKILVFISPLFQYSNNDKNKQIMYQVSLKYLQNDALGKVLTVRNGLNI